MTGGLILTAMAFKGMITDKEGTGKKIRQWESIIDLYVYTHRPRNHVDGKVTDIDFR